MSLLSIVYTNDEAIVVRCGTGDFPSLAADSDRLAWAKDGVFAPSDRWTLTSASNDFEAQRIHSGHLLQLTFGSTTATGVTSEWLAVESVAGHAITLRRIGKLAGEGLPPGPIAGLGGVTFLVKTLDPQIESASWDLNTRFGIDSLVTGRAVSDLYNLRELREAAVLTVLVRQYTALSRFSAESQTGGAVDVFGTKAKNYRQELTDLLARLVIHWGPTGTDRPPTGRFSTRISR